MQHRAPESEQRSRQSKERTRGVKTTLELFLAAVALWEPHVVRLVLKTLASTGLDLEALQVLSEPDLERQNFENEVGSFQRFLAVLGRSGFAAGWGTG